MTASHGQPAERHVARTAWVVLAAVVVTALMYGAARVGISVEGSADQQDSLQPFYDAPADLPAAGGLIRYEPLGVDVAGGAAYRVLFSSERPDGSLAASSGMVVVPDGPPPAGGRPVLAWAHGTIGMGPSCAPSRSADPLASLTTWIEPAMQRGWIVTAPDYTGLGTTGTELYLVGDAEARDVVNSVRAAQGLPGSDAGSRWIVFGHSQGGHSALWTGSLAERLAPELDLLGVAAAAPAAELGDIMSAQWSGVAGWVIGPEVVESWPVVYPDLDVDGVLTSTAQADSSSIAQECIVEAALLGIAREKVHGPYFVADPTLNPSWARAIAEQTPEPLLGMPMLLVQSTADDVVLPWPNAILQVQWCAAGSEMSTMWLGQVNHSDTALVAAPGVVVWAEQVFAGTPPTRDCAAPPPIPAAAPAD